MVSEVDVRGHVTGLSVGPGHAKTYRVVWWMDGKRYEEWIGEGEVYPRPDHVYARSSDNDI
jgi:hypothetical protein